MSKITPDQYETMEAVILSDQVPAVELATLLRENPEFEDWLKERAEKRQGGSR